MIRYVCSYCDTGFHTEDAFVRHMEFFPHHNEED